MKYLVTYEELEAIFPDNYTSDAYRAYMKILDKGVSNEAILVTRPGLLNALRCFADRPEVLRRALDGLFGK